jgi:hypothetical protein
MPVAFEEGYQCLIVSTANPTVAFFEIEITPPDMSAARFNVSTQHNANYHTYAFSKLKDTGSATILAAWAGEAIDDGKAMLGVNDEWTITFPDGSTEVFFGAMTEFKPSGMKIGDRPTVSITIGTSNIDASDGSEVAPTFTAAT